MFRKKKRKIESNVVRVSLPPIETSVDIKGVERMKHIIYFDALIKARKILSSDNK